MGYEYDNLSPFFSVQRRRDLLTCIYFKMVLPYRLEAECTSKYPLGDPPPTPPSDTTLCIVTLPDAVDHLGWHRLSLSVRG